MPRKAAFSFSFLLLVLQTKEDLRQTVLFLQFLLQALGLNHSGPDAIQSDPTNTSYTIFITAHIEPKATFANRHHELYLSSPFYCLLASGKEDLVMKFSFFVLRHSIFAIIVYSVSDF